jgi:hypothetical protein
MFDTGQLPLVVVCEVDAPELDAEVAADEEAPFEVAARAPSSDSRSDPPFDEPDADTADLVLAAAWVVVALWSCHASTPPSESIAATLSAVAALRAFAARGLRFGRGRGGTRRGLAGASGEGACSSMTRNLRMAREGLARTG